MKTNKVLIVDDEASTCSALSEELVKAGFETACAYDGAQGLDILVTFKPDLVLLDLLMPVTSGVDLLRAYKERSEGREPHFIIITNMDAMDAMNATFSHNVTDVVAKSSATIEGIVALVRQRLTERASPVEGAAAHVTEP